MVENDGLRILLVEDSEVHIRMVKAALGGWGGPIDLQVIRHGSDAWKDLEAETLGGDGGAPDLILLDLAIPDMAGLDFLRKLRSIDSLRHVPVIVLTASEDPDEVIEAYRAGANSFVTKPPDLGLFIEAMHKTMVFWTEVATLPVVD